MVQREWLGEKSGIQTTSWGNAISEGPLFLFSHCCSRLPCLLGETCISDCRMESGSFPHITLPAQPQPRWESFEGRKGISCDHEPTTAGWFLGRVSKLKGEGEDVHGKPGRLRCRPLVFILECGEGSELLASESPPAGEGQGADGSH